MSWLGVKYAFTCRDERVKGSARLVLVALGARVEYRRITTSPTSLGELRWLTQLSSEQLRRIVDNLEEWRKVRRLSRGKNAVYALPEMAGPLFAVDDGDPVKMTDFVLENLPSEIGRDARLVTGRLTGFRRRMTDFAGRTPSSSTGVVVDRTGAGSTTRSHGLAEVDRVLDPAVEEFLDWWATSFPLYNAGATSSADRSAVKIVAELLTRRTPLRLREMAIVLWLIDVSEDSWIANSDRSIRVLRHRADFLDQRAATMPGWWHACNCEVKCGPLVGCGLARRARG